MDNQPLPPWEAIDPALTADRIQAIATIAASQTDAKIAVRDPRDWNWNLGCDCHAWVLEGLHAAAEGSDSDWLYMARKRGELDAEFCIGGKDGVRAKFYRPDAPGQPQRTLKQPNEELRVIQEALGPDLAPTAEPVVRFAIDKNEDGRVTAVHLVQLSLEGGLLYRWVIWSSDPMIAPIDSAPRPEGVELDEPDVGLPEDEEQEKIDPDEQQEGA